MGALNHDYCHCFDYDKEKCPEECFRGELVRDLKNRPDLIGIPMTWSNLRNDPDCPLNNKERILFKDGKEICPHCGMVLTGYRGIREGFCKFCGAKIVRNWSNCFCD